MKKLQVELDHEGKIKVHAKRIPPSKLRRRPRYFRYDPEACEDGTFRGRE